MDAVCVIRQAPQSEVPLVCAGASAPTTFSSPEPSSPGAGYDFETTRPRRPSLADPESVSA